jgi:hypothetical protein
MVEREIPEKNTWHAKSEIIINKMLTKKREISTQLNQLLELLA